MSAPPSYDSIVQWLNQEVGPNPTPHAVLDAAGRLSSAEIDILAANRPTAPPPWTPAQRSSFTRGLAKEMETSEGEQYLLDAADKAAAAAASITNMFIQLTAELAAIDSQNAPPREGPFAPRLNVLNQAFNQALGNSRILAVEIAVYGRRFDQVIIPLSGNANYTTEQRRAKIVEFINDADKFATRSAEMQQQFTDLTGEFAIFTGSFSGWANEKEAADSERLREAREELEVLQRRLTDLQVALAALLGVAAISLPVTGGVALFSGPFAPFVIIGGLIAAALSVGAIAGVAISIQKCQGQIADKQREIRDLAEGISQLKSAREELVLLGKSYLDDYKDNLNVIAFIWQSATHDAVRIQEWLEGGAKDADMPEYMQVSLDNAVSTYEMMAKYLDRYARGV